MKIRLALAAATCLALPLAAHAQPVTGPYVSLGAGTSILTPTTVSVQNNGTVSGKALWRPSYAGVADAGYGFGNGFRVQLGVDFLRNTAHEADIQGTHNRIFGGENKYGLMLNALYDFNPNWPIYPYVGGGLGYQWAKANSDVGNGLIKVGGTGGSFAFDVIAGISYPLPWVPGLSATAEYRFMQLTENRNYPTTVPGLAANVEQESSHTFLLGLRYQLFNPPPAPPPAPAPVAAAPAPAPAQTYLVFFDWDKYNLTPRATQIIAQAASDSKTQNVTTLDVSGYTDTSGTPQYNQGLSERRAKAVATQLVQDGVPASEIEIHAYGQTHLLVPTGPGVREPQNRRVEIVLK
ncbi:MAG: OmpA family protein [Acidocella sp.]|nr:OmpA family protein [Acidocella sp.]